MGGEYAKVGSQSGGRRKRRKKRRKSMKC